MKRLLTMPISQIKTDPVGEMLASSDALKPYIDHYKAQQRGGDRDATLGAIAALPESKRYLSRVVECLNWALADFDSETVKLDMPYMSNLDEVKHKLWFRFNQMSVLLKVLQGKE